LLRRLLDKIYKRDEATSEEEPGGKSPITELPLVDSPARDADLEVKPEAEAQAAPSPDEGMSGAATSETLSADGDAIKARVIENIKKVFDPEIPVNVYELGLIYEVRPDDEGMVYVQMTLTAPNCPAAGILPGQVESQARAADGVKDVKLDLVFDPPWTPDRMSEAARLELGML
jgi:FeS assembly SUF system protein